MSRVIFVTALLLLSISTASAQSVSAGDHVRIRSAAVVGSFRVSQVTAKSIILQDSNSVSVEVPFTGVRKLEVNRGPRSQRYGATRGALIGAVIGAGAGLLLSDILGGWDIDGGYETRETRELVPLFSGGLGVIGLVTGGFKGAARPPENCERVHLPVAPRQ